VIVTADELAAIRRQAVDEYPRESCGVVLTRGRTRQLIKCRNIQDQLHTKDPQRHPRDARTAYFIDPQDLLKIGRMEGDGFDIAVIYHSHVDAGAYFSPTDKQQALISGEPTYPAATYIVTSVVSGRAEASAGFRWNPSERDFTPVDVGVDGWAWHERALFAVGRLWEQVGLGARRRRSR
jgi:[CysO sulfur-carrier protein]-S-L-cysteine hydrolase